MSQSQVYTCISLLEWCRHLIHDLYASIWSYIYRMSEQVGYFEAGPLLGNYEVLFRWVKRIKLYKPNLSNPKFQRISGWHNPVILWILYLTYFYMSEWTGLLLLQLLDHISLPSILYFKNESSWNTYNNITDWKSKCDIY